MTPDKERFYEDVYSVVAEIPQGRVVTYGVIACLVGYPQHARLVGRAMACVPSGRRLPCHRVVNSEGRTAPGWPEQRGLLEDEGVRFRPCGRVDLKTALWEVVCVNKKR